MAEEKENQVVEDQESVDEVVETEGAEAEVDTVEDDSLATLQTQYNELEDKYLRVNAEMQNMQTRFAKEQATTLKYATQKLAKSILPALDNLERALMVDADDAAANQIKTGVEMVYKTLENALKDNDVIAVGEVGEVFNPEYHQSVQSQPADDEHPVDTIAQVLQKGYVLADRVVRPAMVVVYN
ncbi:nucleotide exchange factor GrpE [Weissella diestrammenae]|uniref:Protein GrpE n=1 Tax=Weissella diestrammenae TaxID=1162633 RepID=A0A7G9T5L8_9LACO|nr:nucleotide exchange factor GrpE [Weissella diestrammenae]MCM0582220.1 nucleotide exchange factor GrpE [Weissella diestrammenae]QNN75393.1 nucleotide exchange factor GrpE [Weissella diestrammenae]